MSAPGPEPAVARLAASMNGFWTSQLIHVAAQLSLPDRLAAGPLQLDALARVIGADVGALRRLLRALETLELVALDDDESASLRPLGHALRSDAPGALHARALSLGRLAWRSWGELADCVRTGRPAFDRVHGVSFFEYLERHPQVGEDFDLTMRSFTAATAAAVAETHDFSVYGSVVDVGGGTGTFVATLLEACPGLHGVVLDRPDVAARARAALPAALRERCEIEAGDFFEGVPPGHDAYLLSWILHDWDDEDCVRILRNCRQALSPDAEVLIVELLIGAPSDAFARMFDIEMLVQTGGRERSLGEYQRLIEQAGLRLTASKPTRMPHAVLVARADPAAQPED